MMSLICPLSLRNVEDVLAEHEIDISHETVRFWWSRFGPMFAAEIRERRVAHMRRSSLWRWRLDKAFTKVNGRLCYLWRAVDHEVEVLEAGVTAERAKPGALKFLKRIMKKYGSRNVVTDGLCSYPAAMKEIENSDRQENSDARDFALFLSTAMRSVLDHLRREAALAPRLPGRGSPPVSAARKARSRRRNTPARVDCRARVT